MDDSPTTLESVSTKATSKKYSASTEEWMEVVRVASQHYKEALSSNPFYAARMHDERFWFNFVSSRIVAARTLVAKLKASSTAEAAVLSANPTALPAEPK
jgi:hypothetical protein